MAELSEKLRCETESSSKTKKSVADLQQVRVLQSKYVKLSVGVV